MGCKSGAFGRSQALQNARNAIAADLAAGPLARSGPPAARLSRGSRGPLIEPRIVWRALGSSLFSAWAVGLLPLGAAYAFAANNALAPEHVRLAARLGAGLAAVVALSQVAEALAVRRPAWPWSTRTWPAGTWISSAAAAIFWRSRVLHALNSGTLRRWSRYALFPAIAADHR